MSVRRIPALAAFKLSAFLQGKMNDDFFKKYSAGDLASRIGHLQSLCGMLVSAILNTGLTAVFSLLYISQIYKR